MEVDKMIAKQEWFLLKSGFTGKLHMIPTKAAGWLYYLGVFVAILICQVVFPPLVIAVILFAVVDLIMMARKQLKR